MVSIRQRKYIGMLIVLGLWVFVYQTYLFIFLLFMSFDSEYSAFDSEYSAFISSKFVTICDCWRFTQFFKEAL